MSIELIAVSVAYSVLLVVIQRVLINVDRMYELKAHMNKHQTHLMQMVKSKAPQAEIAEKQKMLMAASSESMKMQFKPMVVTLPLYAILYYLVLPNYFSAVPSFSLLGFTLSYRLMFIVVSIILTMALQALVSLYDRRRLRDKYNFGLMQPSFKEEQQQPATN